MKKIIIIEDDHDIADVVELALSAKYVVITHRRSDGIVEVLRAFMPDVMLIDNFIGQKEACQIIKELKKNNAVRFPYILFSGHNDIENIANDIGAIAFLQKPFALADLYNCIEDVIHSTELSSHQSLSKNIF